MLDEDLSIYAKNRKGADLIAEHIWESGCYYGVHVIKRKVDEWTYTDFDDRMV